MIKKTAFIILAIIFALCSCSNGGSSQSQLPQVVSEVAVKSPSAGERSFKLYFLNSDSTLLLTETRTVTISQEENLAVRAVKELIAGSREYNLKRVAPIGTEVTDVLVNSGVATVYLKLDVDSDAKERFFFECAITNTLCDLLGVTYVNVLWNGKILSEIASGLKTRTVGSVAQAYSENVLGAGALLEGTYSIKASIYYPSDDYSYILAEARTMSIKNGDAVTTLLTELKKGSTGKMRSSDVFTSNFTVNSYSIGTVKGKYVLTLKCGELTGLSNADEVKLKAFAASLAFTFQTTLPALEGVMISSSTKGKYLNEVVTMDELYDSAGCLTTIYLQKAKGEILTAVSRVVKQSGYWSVTERVRQLFLGPKTSEAADLWPISPAGLGASDLIDAYVSGDTVYLNFGENFFSAIQSMSVKNERLFIFGLVATAIGDASSVRILENGKAATGTYGKIDLSNELLPNVGLIS